MANENLLIYFYTIKFYKMKNISIFLGLLLALGFNTSIAQIKNVKSTKVAVNGNCGMCKKTIETNGSESNVSKVSWDTDKKIAEISFDSTKTSEEAILKKIALAGYDNAQFRAPDDVYGKLHECCQYDRDHQMAKGGPNAGSHDHMQHGTEHNNHSTDQAKNLDPIFNAYLNLKDALIATDSKAANAAAAKLSSAIQKVDMASLGEKEHHTWMKVKSGLEKSANQISKDPKIESQRNTFINLSNEIYALAKDANTNLELYYQFCPMANNNKGAYWLSKEDKIKNPYFGSKMMTCGEVKEKI